jgi:hypothetical protein
VIFATTAAVFLCALACSWFLIKRKQGHTLGVSPGNVISDLDAMVSEPVGFVLHGRTHVIKPITLEEFYKFVNAWTAVLSWKDSEKVGPREYLSGLTALFQSVCDSITPDDVSKLTQAQAGALFSLIVESVTGKAQAAEVAGSDQKKK